jgi:hypothetical protein
MMYSCNMQIFQHEIVYILGFVKKQILKFDVINGTSFEI